MTKELEDRFVESSGVNRVRPPPANETRERDNSRGKRRGKIKGARELSSNT